MRLLRDGPFFTFLTHSRFPLGIITLMADAEFCLTDEAVGGGLFRHAMGDWGKADEEVQRANDEALREGGPVMSLFVSEPLNRKFRIITEADRRNTYVMLEGEYPEYEAGRVGPPFRDEG